MALSKIPQRKCKKHDIDLNSDKQDIVSAPKMQQNFYSAYCESIHVSEHIFGIRLFLAELLQQFHKAKYTQDRKILAFIAFEFHTFKYHGDTCKCHLNVIGLVQGSREDTEM